jgi:hypothetical protein
VCLSERRYEFILGYALSRDCEHLMNTVRIASQRECHIMLLLSYLVSIFFNYVELRLKTQILLSERKEINGLSFPKIEKYVLSKVVTSLRLTDAGSITAQCKG